MSHILGVLAVATFLLSFQFKKRRNIIAVNLTSRLLYILQYIFLGAFEACRFTHFASQLNFKKIKVAVYENTIYDNGACHRL